MKVRRIHNLKVITLLLAGLRGALGGEPPAARTRIQFSALDGDERPRLGLTAAHFRLRLDGKEAAMEDFHTGRPYPDRSMPLLAWLLVDYSASIGVRMLADQGSAVTSLFDMVHPDSHLGVKAVSDRAETLAPLGSDPETLRRVFAELDRRRHELQAQPDKGTIVLGRAGMLRAIELSMREIDDHARGAGRETTDYTRAIMVISNGMFDPLYDRRPLVDTAARLGIVLYPVFVPRGAYGRWVQDYFDLGIRTGGLGAIFGALHARSTVDLMARGNVGPNALQANLLHMIRDLNGKYSFAAPETASKRVKLDIDCTIPGVRIRLARRELP